MQIVDTGQAIAAIRSAIRQMTATYEAHAYMEACIKSIEDALSSSGVQDPSNPQIDTTPKQS